MAVVRSYREAWYVETYEILKFGDHGQQLSHTFPSLLSYILTFQMVVALVVGVHALACNRVDIIPQAKTIELVVM